MAREGGCEWYQSIGLNFLYISANSKKNFKGPRPILWIFCYSGVGRVKINGLVFLKVRGFFDNDKGNLHYQTKPRKQLLHCLYTSYRNVIFT
jgi:hypothetical protein